MSNRYRLSRSFCIPKHQRGEPGWQTNNQFVNSMMDVSKNFHLYRDCKFGERYVITKSDGTNIYIGIVSLCKGWGNSNNYHFYTVKRTHRPSLFTYIIYGNNQLCTNYRFKKIDLQNLDDSKKAIIGELIKKYYEYKNQLKYE